MPSFITTFVGEESVPNPCNPLENYADKWKIKPGRRVAFYEWHEAAVDHLDQVLGSFDKGKETLFESLTSAYGTQVVKRATIKQAELRRSLAESFKIGVTKGTGITAPIVGPYTSSKLVMPVKKQTFFGDR